MVDKFQNLTLKEQNIGPDIPFYKRKVSFKHFC